MDHVPQASERVRFILVEPSHPGNIGSAARAVKTMGFTDRGTIETGKRADFVFMNDNLEVKKVIRGGEIVRPEE